MEDEGHKHPFRQAIQLKPFDVRGQNDVGGRRGTTASIRPTRIKATRLFSMIKVISTKAMLRNRLKIADTAVSANILNIILPKRLSDHYSLTC